MKVQLWAPLLLLGLAQGLDVELVSTTCDDSLPVTADLYLQCENGGSRCTFGNSSTLSGTCEWLVCWRSE